MCVFVSAPWSGKILVFIILVQHFVAREHARKLIFFLLCNTQRHPQKNKLSFLSKYNFFDFFLVKNIFFQTNQLNTIYTIKFNNHFLPLPTCDVILVIASTWLFKPLSAPLLYSLQKATVP